MTPELRAKLQGELTRLTEGSSPQGKATFAESFWRNVNNWEDQFRTDSAKALEALAEAQLARVMVTEHPGSPQYAQARREDFMRRTTPEAREACRHFSPSSRKAIASG